MLNEVVEAFFDQSVDFEEVSGNKDGYGIFDIKFGAVVLLDS